MMSFKEFQISKAKQNVISMENRNSISSMDINKNDKVAGPLQKKQSGIDKIGIINLENTEASHEKQQQLPPSATSTSSGTSTSQNSSQIKISTLFPFIGNTYREIRGCISGLHKDLYNTRLLQTINNYKIGCNKILDDVFESYEMSFKLAQNIIRTMDLFKDLCTTYTNMEEYQHRICELMAIFITCELKLSLNSAPEEQSLIPNRILYIMHKHLLQEDKEETRYTILRTLLYIPRMFNAREIMCAIFEEFLQLKPTTVKVLPDKLYMLYIIAFYRWMMLQKNSDDKQVIVNIAENLMKPSVTLCSNKLYANYLPRYTTHSTATRTILNNMNFYKDIRNASFFDNALKKMGTIVNLCDDDEDADVIVVDDSSNVDFAELFASVQLERLDSSLTNIKLEEETVVDTVDLTSEEETIKERHDKWLNSFQRLAKQFREYQTHVEKQQSLQTAETHNVICLDSDSEEEPDKEVTVHKEIAIIDNNEPTGGEEDLFKDSYPLTTTPINCESDLESSDAEDADDMTKLSMRFLPSTLRTYQVKSKDKLTSTELEQEAQLSESSSNKEKSDSSIVTAYRRDSIHISSSPPERALNDEDDGTDVQDEHEDDIDVDEGEPYTFLATTPKNLLKEALIKEIKPMCPYPTYNNLNSEKVVFSQARQQQKHYYSDSSEAKTAKKEEQQKKRVHFNTSPLGPTSAYSTKQNKKLKSPPLNYTQQHKYKASDAPDYFHMGALDRFSCIPSIAGSTSTTASTSTSSSMKQQQEQEHIAATATLFRNIFDRTRVDRMTHTYPTPFSPSSSSASSRSLMSPATAMESHKKSRYQNSSIKTRRTTICSRDNFNKQQQQQQQETSSDERNSIIRNRDIFNSKLSGPPGIPCTSFMHGKSVRDSSDEYYDVVSDSDTIKSVRLKDDDKLRKRCAVVITPTKEILQYERQRDKMYIDILKRQRKKLELRAIEKQKEKERRRLEREEKREQTKWNARGSGYKGTAMDRDKQMREYRNSNDMFMSSESELETHNQLHARKQKHHHQQQQQKQQQLVKELQPLNIQIEMTEATTSLLNEIDAHLDKPETVGSRNDVEEETLKLKKHRDIEEKVGQASKMRELNLLADIAQRLSPYQLELQENYELQTTPTTVDKINVPPITLENQKVPAVSQPLLTQSFDNLLEKQLEFSNQTTIATTEQECHDYEHQPQAAKFPSSPGNYLDIENRKENNTQNKICKNSKEEALEQFLEESISVLKPVTSPPSAIASAECSLKESHDRQTIKPRTESIIPLLISSVESLNHLDANINKNKPPPKSCTEEKSKKLKEKSYNGEIIITENILLNKAETKELESNKESSKDMKHNKTSTFLTSTFIESSLNAADLSDLSCDHDITKNFKSTSIMPADISDISLESEMCKQLPDVAEPSPIVTTDISDNSMESEITKSFTETSAVSPGIMDISLPVLPLVLSSFSQPPLTEPHIENNFNINTTLNTPTKMQSHPIMDSIAQQSDVSLNTPIKTGLEPETDTNVTKFLDLILNKTVTDAESETRDKILKELNAITADNIITPPPLEDTAESGLQDKILKELNTTTSDTTAVSHSLEETETDKINNHNKSNDSVSGKIKSVESIVEDFENKSVDSIATVIENKSLESANKLLDSENKSIDYIANEFTPVDSIVSEPENKSLHSSNLPHKQNTFLDSSASARANNLLDSVSANGEENNTQPNEKACDVFNDCEIKPPKLSLNEHNTQTPSIVAINNDDSDITPSSDIPSSVPYKPKSPIKQTYNIKCRVRLKRLNIAEHCKTNNKETWVAMPITNSEETVAAAVGNNEISNCDNNKNETKMSSLIKKPCLKHNANNKQMTEHEVENKISEDLNAELPENITKKPKLDTPPEQTIMEEPPLLFNAIASIKPKSKPLKTVTFDLSNIHDELRGTPSSSHKQKFKAYNMKSHRTPKKLPENTLRAAETLQIFVNTINDSTRTPPPAEFNKKRSPIKNKCIAEDETPRPPLASALMDGNTHKKTEKARSSAKCKDQLVLSLATAAIPAITSDITTARIYTSSPLDQTLPEYDDNVDTVADSELILPTTTGMGSLRRKLKKPKKSLTRPEPAYDTSAEDISNQPPECNGDDDTDAVADNDDDVFAQNMLPIPAANEQILEEIVSVRTPHIVAGTSIRDDYMNIEATATVPVYLFNDESRDLATPEPIQNTGETNVVDSSSFLNTSSTATSNLAKNITASATTNMGNLEKSMLSPSEHEVSSTQETFFQTPTKTKQNGDRMGDKVITATKDKTSPLALTTSQKQQEDNLKTKKDKTSSICLLQNNQVDTTNHSPEMCTLTLTTSSSSSNSRIRKASTHDEILFNELPQQQQQKRKPTTFCAESTSDNNKKSKVMPSTKKDEINTNGSLRKLDTDKVKMVIKDNKRDKIETVGVVGICNAGGGGGGSSPSTTTTINEDHNSRARRKKMKSSKSEKLKNNENSDQKHQLTTTTTTTSNNAPHLSANPLLITIPKSRLLRPPPTPSPKPHPEQAATETPTSAVNNKVKDKEKHHHHHHNHQSLKREISLASDSAHTKTAKKSKRTYSPANMVQKVFVPDDIKQCIDSEQYPLTTTKNTQEEKPTSLTVDPSSLSSTVAPISSLTVSNRKKRGRPVRSSSNSRTTNGDNLSHVKDKHHGKNKDKHQHILENKEKLSGTICKTKEKHDNNYTKLSSQHKHKSSSSSSSKEKEKIKDKEKLTAMDTQKSEAPAKILKSITHSSSNNKTPTKQNTTPTLNNTNSNNALSPSSSSSAIYNKQTSSKLTKTNNTITKNSSDPNAASSNSIKSKSSLSTIQLTSASSLATSSSSMTTTTISTNHVKKKLKTK